ncbi:MAG: argininosuccinate lyase, partial [Lachnospiraceae bacterium]|nr:argininosuccinate lyase [Lachnospiraceae bacterium]
MAQLWGGRFTKETEESVFKFNESFSFDQRLFFKDIEGSVAHVVMLEKQKIITLEEKDAIVKGLTSIQEDVEKGRLTFEEGFEDVHSFIEAKLIERIGDAGKKMHTGRSRNDQVALDMRLYVREEIVSIDDLLYDLLKVIYRVMSENIETYMPGFTHLQKAQPVTVAHHLGAYFEMFKRDRSRLKDLYNRMNFCP